MAKYRSKDWKERQAELEKAEKQDVDPASMKPGSKISPTWKYVEAEAKQIDEELTQLQMTKVERTLKVGELLHQVHDKLAHYGNGAFYAWTRDRIKIGRQTAWRWQRLGDLFKGYDRPTLIQSFTLTGLYELSLPSIKQKVRDEAFERAKKGELITKGVAKKIIDKHQPNPRIPTMKRKSKKTLTDADDDSGPMTKEICLENIRAEIRTKFAERLKKLPAKHLLYFHKHFGRVMASMKRTLRKASKEELAKLDNEIDSVIQDSIERHHREQKQKERSNTNAA